MFSKNFFSERICSFDPLIIKVSVIIILERSFYIPLDYLLRAQQFIIGNFLCSLRNIISVRRNILYRIRTVFGIFERPDSGMVGDVSLSVISYRLAVKSRETVQGIIRKIFPDIPRIILPPGQISGMRIEPGTHILNNPITAGYGTF